MLGDRFPCSSWRRSLRRALGDDTEHDAFGDRVCGNHEDDRQEAAGIASVISSQSISTTGVIMKTPTMIRAGAVATLGIELKAVRGKGDEEENGDHESGQSGSSAFDDARRKEKIRRTL